MKNSKVTGAVILASLIAVIPQTLAGDSTSHKNPPHHRSARQKSEADIPMPDGNVKTSPSKKVGKAPDDPYGLGGGDTKPKRSHAHASKHG
ncbi:MAG TPA: hypothetical protein PLX89_00085 [Verrucomicrobiota bacterium]|nr:hypothetical protein [Verrucomicrobiales bacterium]HRI11375.1 hypothetical protein [Verrucomicrobiota bacterium]